VTGSQGGLRHPRLDDERSAAVSHDELRHDGRQRAISASPAGGPGETFRAAGLVNPCIIVPVGARVTIGAVNADPDSAHGLVVTASAANAAWMPMMTTSGTYHYLCPAPATPRGNGRRLHRPVSQAVLRCSAGVRHCRRTTTYITCWRHCGRSRPRGPGLTRSATKKDLMHRVIRPLPTAATALVAAAGLSLGTSAAAGASVNGYGTKSHQIVFLAGTEGHPDVAHRVAGVHGQFSAPAVEVASLYPPADKLPIGAQQAAFSRVGVTQLLRPRQPFLGDPAAHVQGGEPRHAQGHGVRQAANSRQPADPRAVPAWRGIGIPGRRCGLSQRRDL
jgi:hypothetical protein